MTDRLCVMLHNGPLCPLSLVKRLYIVLYVHVNSHYFMYLYNSFRFIIYVSDVFHYEEEPGSFVTCRPDLLIPEHNDLERATTTPAPPITGAPGVDGPPGPTGPRGSIGARGPKGNAGPQGDSGLRGEKGRDGDDGARGPTGRNGIDGNNGDDGAQGQTGQPGATGARGPKGERGPAGKVIYVNDGTGKPIVSEDEDGFSTIAIASIVWLVVLTIIILILIIAVILISRRRRNRKSSHNSHAKLVEDPSSSGSSIQRMPSSAGDYPHSWVSTLKEGSEMGLGVDVISTPSSSVTATPIGTSTPQGRHGDRTLVVGQKPDYLDATGEPLEHWTKNEVINY